MGMHFYTWSKDQVRNFKIFKVLFAWIKYDFLSQGGLLAILARSKDASLFQEIGHIFSNDT
jgi:hypothetical protein